MRLLTLVLRALKADRFLAVSIAGVTVTNSRGQTLLRVAPNAFPATRFSVQKEPGDDTPVDYVQVGLDE